LIEGRLLRIRPNPPRRCEHFATALLGSMSLLALAVAPTTAQMTSRPVRDGSRPVRAGSGPVSELSTNVRSGSGPVSGDGGSLRHSSHDRLGGNTVRGSTVTDLRSGSVSDASVGSVHTRAQPRITLPPIDPDYLPDAGDVGADPWSPVWDLHPLAERIRGVDPLSREAQSEPEDEEAAFDDDATALADETDEPSPADDLAESDAADADEDREGDPDDGMAHEGDAADLDAAESDEPEPPPAYDEGSEDDASGNADEPMDEAPADETPPADDP